MDTIAFLDGGCPRLPPPPRTARQNGRQGRRPLPHTLASAPSLSHLRGCTPPCTNTSTKPYAHCSTGHASNIWLRAGWKYPRCYCGMKATQQWLPAVSFWRNTSFRRKSTTNHRSIRFEGKEETLEELIFAFKSHYPGRDVHFFIV